MERPSNNKTPITMRGDLILSSTRDLLTHILNHLATVAPPSTTTTSPTSTDINELPSTLPPTTKPLLLTLHSLLPHCLLPALDILDRGLVERWIPASSPTIASAWVYYITSKPASSASISTNPYRTNTVPSTSTSTTYIYEVRPSIWHCTCANFTLYASASSNETATLGEKQHRSAVGCNEQGDAWLWGSSLLSPSHSSSIPICKHLLAAVLIEQCPALFGKSLREKKGVSREEMAEKACWWD